MMLSAAHHAWCWGLSAIAAIIYDGLLFLLRCSQDVFRALLYPLIAYATFVIVTGPRPRHHQWPLYYFVATELLMLCLGVVADDYATNRNYLGGYTRGVIHAMLAFSAIATLEAVRQNVT